MLTASEREWLEHRCNYCDWCSLELSSDACYRSIGNDECPLYPMGATAWSAAEFEARVAALIAKLYADKFADVVLKHARLQVEEEMDNEMDKRKAR